MSVELSLDGVKASKSADYLKSFKDKAFWKNKANYAIFMVGYQLDKKITVALPFKKDTDAKAIFKRIRKEKIHGINRVAIGSFEWKDEENSCLFSITGGGADPAKLELMAGKLFEKMKVGFKVVMGAIDPEMAAVAAEMTETIAEEESEESEDLVDALPFDWKKIGIRASQLFFEAQAFIQNPKTEQAAILHQNISHFVGEYQTAMNECGDSRPEPALIKQYTSLSGLLQKLEMKLSKPKAQVESAIVQMVNNYGGLFREVREAIVPFLKANPQAMLPIAQQQKIQQALALIQEIRAQFPNAEAAIKNKLSDFLKNLDSHEPQLLGIANRIANAAKQAAIAARDQLQKQRQEIAAFYAQLPAETKARLSN